MHTCVSNLQIQWQPPPQNPQYAKRERELYYLPIGVSNPLSNFSRTPLTYQAVLNAAARGAPRSTHSSSLLINLHRTF
jgi:hypothetical protein